MFADIQTTRQRKSSNNAERNTIVIYFLISDGEIHLVRYTKVLIIMLVIPYKY